MTLIYKSKLNLFELIVALLFVNGLMLIEYISRLNILLMILVTLGANLIILLNIKIIMLYQDHVEVVYLIKLWRPIKHFPLHIIKSVELNYHKFGPGPFNSPTLTWLLSDKENKIKFKINDKINSVTFLDLKNLSINLRNLKIPFKINSDLKEHILLK